MSAERAGVTARLWGRARRKRIRFKDAVPVRPDRRDLRRQFRRAARAATADRKAETGALLWRLSANRVPLSVVLPGAQDDERIIEFSDGTRVLLLEARHETGNLKRLAPGDSRSPVWLGQARPCFARRWFRLWFASAARRELVEVLASVTPVAPALPA